jgi:transcriptional regulator with XRE-family HTH domain
MTPSDFRMARRLLRLTQADLAARLGYGGTVQSKRTIISRWERGKVAIPAMAGELVALWALSAFQKEQRRARRERKTGGGSE